MATAVLYIRVSTDEQAQKGFSQRNQEEKLRRYCMQNQIEILRSIFEDCSAKNFNRPAWSEMMKSFNISKRSRPDLILFTRWDRFSRNTANAYYVITLLMKMRIEPQAIEQPLDLSIPENKVLLAMYIVTAEVENDRRSLNVKYGMHRAKLEGRWMGLAPFGYTNVSMSNGNKTIIPIEPQASLVVKAFETLAISPSVCSAYRELRKIGFQSSLSFFIRMLKQPLYCGKIRIMEAQEKLVKEVRGNYQALISEELFNLVKSRMEQSNKRYSKQTTNPILMLRGFLYCPICSRKLTGSGSKGRSKKYFYYHCTHQCRYRIRADIINENFIHQIEKLKPQQEYIEFFRSLLKEKFGNGQEHFFNNVTSLNKSLNKLVDRAANARELLIKGIIAEEDHFSIKADCEQRIKLIGEQLNTSYLDSQQRNKSIDRCLSFLTNPILLFDSNNGDIAIRAAALFASEKFSPVEELKAECLNCVIYEVYGLSCYEGNQLCEEHLEHTSSPEEHTTLSKKVLKTNNYNYRPTPPPHQKNTLNFLNDLLKLCIDKCVQLSNYISH